MNQSETKTCQNCQKPFVIEPDDFLFYEKMQIPPPTFCPDCRLQRRLAWRNERMLYRRTCDGTKANILAIYPLAEMKKHRRGTEPAQVLFPVNNVNIADTTQKSSIFINSK